MDHGYVHEIDAFEFIDGLWRDARLKNGLCAGGGDEPVGIARGKFTEAQFETLTEWMDWSLADLWKWPDLDGIYYCPHHPQGSIEKEFTPVCDCRKPHPECLSRRVISCISIWQLLPYFAIGETSWKILRAAAAANVGTKVLVRTKTANRSRRSRKRGGLGVRSSLADLPSAIKSSKNKRYG